MKDKILIFDDDSLVFVSDVPLIAGSTSTVRIELPEGVSLYHLTLHGTVIKCLPVYIESQEIFLLELNVPSLDNSTRSILQAYIKYLHQEKRLDNTIADILKACHPNQTVVQDKIDFQKQEIREYLLARIQDVQFN